MPDSGSDELVFFVNGKKVVEKNADPEMTLLTYLRNKLRLTGTKLGCAEGGCGACTVMVSTFNRTHSTITHYSVNACLAPLCSMHGLAVTTVEGIGSTKTRLHPVQERLAKSHGSQCGFCTPGIVMSMYTLLRNNPQPSVLDMEKAFEGNLCRCTGYRPIIEGFRSFTKEFQCGMGDQCCRNKAQNACNGDSQAEPAMQNGPVTGTEAAMENGVSNGAEFAPYDASQEPVFPSELQLDGSLDEQSLTFRSDRATWYRPLTLNDLVELKTRHPDAKLVIGNTEVGVEVKFKNMHYPVLIAATHIPELNAVENLDGGLRFGASVTLSRMEEVLTAAVKQLPEWKTRVYAAVLEMLRWFAGHQVRNVAALGGNLVTASPISDLNPLWLAAGCQVTLVSKGGERIVKMDDQFFCGYRKTALKPQDILLNITVPFTSENEYFCGYKQAHRRDDDIAIVNAGMRVLFEEGSNVIRDIALAYGGMAPCTVMATKTMKELVGRPWDESLVARACELLEEDLPLPAGAPGGMEPYRRTLTTSFFFKFYLTVQLHLHNSQCPVPDSYASATPLHQREPSRGVQVYEEVAPGQSADDPVGRPLTHMSATKQVTGEAEYCDDMPPFQNELYMALVTSTKAHANILHVDATDALKMPGVVDYICHKDIQGTNVMGHVVFDEVVFATDKVTYQGQVIGAILADTQCEAQRAAKVVKVTYEELQPIITIEEAIAAGSFFPQESVIKNGDLEKGFSASDHIIEGEFRMGGQEHFYLETNAAIAVPRGDELEIFCSTQSASMTQIWAARAIGVLGNRSCAEPEGWVGGGFGGKETRSVIVSTPLAVAAHKHNRPVRCMLDRDEDMVCSGTRHPFLGRYKVGFSKEGKILALEEHIYSNAGNTLDLSAAVNDRALFHSDNCYRIPNISLHSHICRTNLASNTAFRGFGGPQGLMICEDWMTTVATTLGIPQEQVRAVNLYQEGDKTHFNQPLINCTIQRCWDQVIEQSNYHQRQEGVDTFNKSNRWKKRGISVVPVKFGISFTALFLNQAGALVHVYTDGSVLVAHAGVEMGQGLHTKMIQVASRALNVPVAKIHISETSTQTVPNMSPTAASASSDLNGMAVMIACQTIRERLEPYIRSKPKGSWEEWVNAAYFDRVSLSSTGYYKTPDIGYNFETNSGNPFAYYTFGAAVSEVEVDCLTGDHTVLRTDIVMDLGTSLNPAIDIGQIEGAFVQGYGLFTLEEQRYSPQGFLYTRGPGMYKIPGFTDIPIEFNVSLLKGATNPRAVYSSKAVGEPPLFLAASVFFAIKEAVRSARAEVGLTGHFPLDSPATAERIRMACVDQFTKQFPAAEPGSYQPWSVLL